MSMKTMAALALAVLTLAGLTGCASTIPDVKRDAPVSSAMLEEATFMVNSTRQTNALLYRLGAAAADQCTTTDAAHRAPFSLLFNGANPSEELRTAIYKVAGVAELPLLQTHVPELKAYEGARVRTINRQATGNINKVYAALRTAFEKNDRLELVLDDGRSLSTVPTAACPSFVLTDYSGKLKEAFNNFNGTEVTPRSWLQLAHTEDERAFILARSIYFTGADGDPKLRHAFYGGSAASGILNGLTFGLGTLVADPKQIAVRMRRSANRSDADAFALTVMRRAGFDPQAALRFARRSIDEGSAWPHEADELKFDADRLAELQRSLAPGAVIARPSSYSK